MFKSKRLLFILIVVAGIVLGLIAVSRTQDLRRKASEKDKVGRVVISSEKISTNKPGISRIDILFKTGTNEKNKNISSLSFRLEYPLKNQGEFVVTDEQGNISDKLVLDNAFLNNKEWEFPVNKVKKENNKLTIDLAAIDLTNDGFLSQNFTPIAHLYIKDASLAQENLSKIAFVEEYSRMFTKEKPIIDILNTSGGIIYQGN